MPTDDLVVLGDSVAQGWHDPAPTGGWIGWAGRLASNVNLPTDRLHNMATSGARLEDVARGQLPLARKLRPRLVLLNCGMNDALNDVDPATLPDHLAEILGWAQANDASTLIAAVPTTAPMLNEGSVISRFRRERTLRSLNHVNTALREAADRYGANLLSRDDLPSLTDPSLWHRDGIHLGPAGHAYVARMVTPIAQRALNQQMISDGQASGGNQR